MGANCPYCRVMGKKGVILPRAFGICSSAWPRVILKGGSKVAFNQTERSLEVAFWWFSYENIID